VAELGGIEAGAAGAAGATGTSSVTSADARPAPGIWKKGRKSSARMVGVSESRMIGCGSLIGPGSNGWKFAGSPVDGLISGLDAADESDGVGLSLGRVVTSSLASRGGGGRCDSSGTEGVGMGGGERKRRGGAPTVDRYGIAPAWCSSGPLPGGRIRDNAKALSVAVAGRSTSSRQFNALLKPAGESGGSR